MERVTYQSRSTDGVIGTSGTPKDIYGYSLFSSGGGGAVVDFHDGTSTGGTKAFSATGTTSQVVNINFGGVGVRLGSGCYLNVDANTQAITIFYKEVR